MSSSRPRLLDLFCGAGGAAMGYHRAGFEVVGVDLKPQPRYPFEFHCANALDFIDRGGLWHPDGPFDAIHASPPCQFHSHLKPWNRREHADLIPETRLFLISTGLPFVIENVPGAPLRNPIVLCGSMFGLGVEGYQLRRHRLFESNEPLYDLLPPCAHLDGPTLGVYGDHIRTRRRSRRVNDGQLPNALGLRLARAAMGIDWMAICELSQAIPPAYTEFIGRRLLEVIAA